ncbi:DUF2207 domain-containing protein, partial [Lactobacillus sp. XV13L]|nr:DUF2207 domain-containing protein [Lactobacillus sp. XV13L]
AVSDQGLLSTKIAEQRSLNQTGLILLMVINVAAAVMAVGIFHRYTALVLIGEPIIVVLAIIAFVLSTRRVSIYTAKGAKETDKVRGFKKMLDDIGRFKMRDVGDLVLWEDIMPYAVAFNLAKKVLKELKVEFSDEELAQGGFYFYGPFYSSGSDGFASSFNDSFTAGVSSGSSSVSGGSGGFSGGSSGGFGGGSGGGAF